jgi:hypothetical protein
MTKEMTSNETPYICNSTFETDPRDQVIKFGKMLDRPAILFRTISGFVYAIIDQRHSGHQVSYAEIYSDDEYRNLDWDNGDIDIVFGNIGPKTLARVERLWESHGGEKLEEIKKLE